ADVALERLAVLLRDRLAAAHLDLGRVDEAAALLDREVELRAGREAGHPDVADDVLLAHALADLLAGPELRHVHVRGRPAVVVLDHDAVAGAALPAAEGDDAAGGRPDRRAGRRRVIDAHVAALDVQDRGHPGRVEARPETRRLG